MSGSFSTYALEAFLFLSATAVAVLYILGFFHKTTASAAHHSGSPSIPTSFTCTLCDGPYETLDNCDARSPGTCGCEDGYHRDSRDNSCIPTQQVSNIACPPIFSTICTQQGIATGQPKYLDTSRTNTDGTYPCENCPDPASGSYTADCTGCNSGRSVVCADLGCPANQYRTGCGNTGASPTTAQYYSPGACTDCVTCTGNTEIKDCGGINPGRCVCAAGYGGNAATNTCETCPPGYYKPDAGDDECTPCVTCPTNENEREKYRSGCGNTQPGSCETCQGCEEEKGLGYYRQGCGRFSELDANVAGTCTMCTLFQPGNDPVGNYRRNCGEDTPARYNNEGTVTACSEPNAALCPTGQVRTGCGCTLDIGRTKLVSSPTAIPYPTIMNSNGSPTSLATCVQKCRMFNTSNNYVLNVDNVASTSTGYVCPAGKYARVSSNRWEMEDSNVYIDTSTSPPECGNGVDFTRTVPSSDDTTPCNAVNFVDNVCTLMHTTSSSSLPQITPQSVGQYVIVQDVPACYSSGPTPTQYLYNNNCYTCGNVAVRNTATSSDAPYEYMTSPGTCAIPTPSTLCSSSSSTNISLGSGSDKICASCCSLTKEFCSKATNFSSYTTEGTTANSCHYSDHYKQCLPSSIPITHSSSYPRGFCDTCTGANPVLLNGTCTTCCSLTTKDQCDANNGVSCRYSNTLQACLPKDMTDSDGVGLCPFHCEAGVSEPSPACATHVDATSCKQKYPNCTWDGVTCNECVPRPSCPDPSKPASLGGECVSCCAFGNATTCNGQTNRCHWNGNNGECVKVTQPVDTTAPSSCPRVVVLLHHHQFTSGIKPADLGSAPWWGVGNEVPGIKWATSRDLVKAWPVGGVSTGFTRWAMTCNPNFGPAHGYTGINSEANLDYEGDPNSSCMYRMVASFRPGTYMYPSTLTGKSQATLCQNCEEGNTRMAITVPAKEWPRLKGYLNGPNLGGITIDAEKKICANSPPDGYKCMNNYLGRNFCSDWCGNHWGCSGGRFLPPGVSTAGFNLGPKPAQGYSYNYSCLCAGCGTCGGNSETNPMGM